MFYINYISSFMILCVVGPLELLQFEFSKYYLTPENVFVKYLFLNI